nr:uncharacterized protein LOC106689021 [Halyomorpha halys]
MEDDLMLHLISHMDEEVYNYYRLFYDSNHIEKYPKEDGSGYAYELKKDQLFARSPFRHLKIFGTIRYHPMPKVTIMTLLHYPRVFEGKEKNYNEACIRFEKKMVEIIERDLPWEVLKMVHPIYKKFGKPQDPFHFMLKMNGTLCLRKEEATQSAMLYALFGPFRADKFGRLRRHTTLLEASQRDLKLNNESEEEGREHHRTALSYKYLAVGAQYDCEPPKIPTDMEMDILWECRMDRAVECFSDAEELRTRERHYRKVVTTNFTFDGLFIDSCSKLIINSMQLLPWFLEYEIPLPDSFKEVINLAAERFKKRVLGRVDYGNIAVATDVFKKIFENAANEIPNIKDRIQFCGHASPHFLLRQLEKYFGNIHTIMIKHWHIMKDKVIEPIVSELPYLREHIIAEHFVEKIRSMLLIYRSMYISLVGVLVDQVVSFLTTKARLDLKAFAVLTLQEEVCVQFIPSKDQMLEWCNRFIHVVFNNIGYITFDSMLPVLYKSMTPFHLSPEFNELVNFYQELLVNRCESVFGKLKARYTSLLCSIFLIQLTKGFSPSVIQKEGYSPSVRRWLKALGL